MMSFGFIRNEKWILAFVGMTSFILASGFYLLNSILISVISG